MQLLIAVHFIKFSSWFDILDDIYQNAVGIFGNKVSLPPLFGPEIHNHRKIFAFQTEFSQKGYAAASTEAIVKAANVTRGALYHHFRNKRDLFHAVFTAAQKEIGRRIEVDADAEDDLWQGLISGCRAFLEACSEPKLQQIVVIDAPSVLDWNTYRQVDQNMPDSGLALLKEGLQELLEKRMIKALPLDALTHLLSGAMDEAAVWVAQSATPKVALTEAKEALETLLEGLRVN